MNCKECREFIFSDYLDGELTGPQRSALEAHLSQCAQCRVLAEEAKIELTAPFEDLEPVQPPESVWQNIKAHIETRGKETPQPQKPGLLGWLAGFPKPAFALGAVAAILIAVIFFREPAGLQIVQNKEVEESPGLRGFQEEVSYIASIMDADINSEETDGYGTAIEEYFL